MTQDQRTGAALAMYDALTPDNRRQLFEIMKQLAAQQERQRAALFYWLHGQAHSRGARGGAHLHGEGPGEPLASCTQEPAKSNGGLTPRATLASCTGRGGPRILQQRQP